MNHRSCSMGRAWPRPGRRGGGCPYVFGQVGRVVVRGVWNDMPVHAGDQVGEGVPAELAVFLRVPVDGRPMKITPSVCEGRGGRVFLLLVNASGAERECSGCGPCVHRGQRGVLERGVLGGRRARCGRMPVWERGVRGRGRAYDRFRSMAAGRHLASDLHRVAGPGGCQGADHLGPQRRLHDRARPPARRRCA